MHRNLPPVALPAGLQHGRLARRRSGDGVQQAMAGLIPQGFVDELLNRVDIVETIDRRVTLRKAGKNYQARCPFHQEKTPSFSVQPERQFFYCFGCGAGGNAIGFIMKFHNLGFPEAVEALARDAGLEVPRQESPQAARRSAEQRALFDCLQQANEYYRSQLRGHPMRDRAVAWCKSRGISGPVAREFQIGYAPPGWENLAQALGIDETARARLLEAGLVIARKNGAGEYSGKRSCYDRFRDRVVFPIRDSRGRTVGFGGRVLDDSAPKYLNSPETPVFQKSRELYGLYEAPRNKTGKLLLVEGYMDVIALAGAGIRNAVATLGTSTSARQIQRMFRHAPEIVFSFDGDEAGRKAAWRALETSLPLMADGKSVKFLFLPEGEDPDSAVRKLGAEQFLALIDAAQPLETLFFEHLSEGLDTDSIEGRAALGSKAAPLIRKLPESVYRELMLERLAEITGADKQALLKSPPDAAKRDRESPPWSEGEFADFDSRPVPATPPGYPPEPGRAQARRGMASPPGAGLVAIRLLLRAPEIALKSATDSSLLAEADDEVARLLFELVEKVRENPDIEYFALLEHCYRSKEMRGRLTEAIGAEKIEPADRKQLELEFRQILENLLAKYSRKLLDRRLRDQLRAKTAAKGHNEA